MIIDATRDCQNCYCHLVCAIYNPHFDNYAPECNLYMGKEDYKKVIRCQECKHCTKYELQGDVLSRIYRCGLSINACDEDFFCSYGEKKGVRNNGLE